MRAWQCDCGKYVDGPSTRHPIKPQPSPRNVELEGELAGCQHCDPSIGALERVADNADNGENNAIRRKA